MTDFEFLKGCGISLDSPDAELALKLRIILAQQLSELKPEDVTPDMTCETLMHGIRWFDGDPDMLEIVMTMEEATGKDIPDYAAVYMISPSQKTKTTIRQLLTNWMDILAKLNAGESFPPRRLTFWTDKRHYHWMAWILPVFGAFTLIAALIGIPWLVKENAGYPFVFGIISLFVIWLGVRLWKYHRVTLDRLLFEHKYRAVLYTPGSNGVLLEPYDFTVYGGWEFSDAATASKQAEDIAAFLNLPLEYPLTKNIILFRGWNPADWDAIDTMPFFLELSSFCEKCRKAGFAVGVDTLLDTIRGLSSFSSLAGAVAKLDAELPRDVLSAERKALLEVIKKTNRHVGTYFKFLQECEVESGTMGAYQARNLRKLCAAGSDRLTEHEVTASMRLGDLAPQWFTSDNKTETLLEWTDFLGDECATLLNALQPCPDWTIKELVQKYVDAYTNQYFPHSKKREGNLPEAKP